jgi:phosphoribosylamine-glycine ligase
MNILIIGENDFGRILGNKLKLSHHYDKHFILSTNQLVNEPEVIDNIGLDDEQAIINFCFEQQVDVVVLAHKPLLDKGFYDTLKSNSLMNKTIIVGASLQTIQQLNNLVATQSTALTDLKTTEQIVVLTDGKFFKILNEQNKQELNEIEEQIIKKVKNIELNISGFLCFNVVKNNHSFELSSFQFVINNEVAENIFERLETDVLSLFAAIDNGTLEDVNIEFYER